VLYRAKRGCAVQQTIGDDVAWPVARPLRVRRPMSSESLGDGNRSSGSGSGSKSSGAEAAAAVAIAALLAATAAFAVPARTEAPRFDGWVWIPSCAKTETSQIRLHHASFFPSSGDDKTLEPESRTTNAVSRLPRKRGSTAWSEP
jgi:hypothetical protein